MNRLAHYCLRVPLQNVVWIPDTFDDNFKIKNDFHKYLKESSWLCPDQHFSIKYFSDDALMCAIFHQGYGAAFGRYCEHCRVNQLCCMAEAEQTVYSILKK